MRIQAFDKMLQNAPFCLHLDFDKTSQNRLKVTKPTLSHFFKKKGLNRMCTDNQ